MGRESGVILGREIGVCRKREWEGGYGAGILPDK